MTDLLTLCKTSGTVFIVTDLTPTSLTKCKELLAVPFSTIWIRIAVNGGLLANTEDLPTIVTSLLDSGAAKVVFSLQRKFDTSFQYTDRSVDLVKTFTSERVGLYTTVVVD